MPKQNSYKKSGAGFTLLETLIYLGLFAILMTGVGVSAYAVIEAAGRDQTRVMAQEEAGFLLGKINWALTGASSIQIPASGVPAPSLSLNKYVGINPLVFDLSGTTLRLKQGSGSATGLNSGNVQVTNLAFTDIPAASGKPEGITVSFTLKSLTPRGATINQDFSTAKYLRN